MIETNTFKQIKIHIKYMNKFEKPLVWITKSKGFIIFNLLKNTINHILLFPRNICGNLNFLKVLDEKL
jgi:hypothetical protein